jgi:hypothetical protein
MDSNNSNMASYVNTLNNQLNPNIIQQQQFMNQNNRLQLPPNIRQQIQNNQNFPTMQNQDFNNSTLFNQQTQLSQNFNQQTSQQNIYHHQQQQQHLVNYQPQQQWSQKPKSQQQWTQQLHSQQQQQGTTNAQSIQPVTASSNNEIMEEDEYPDDNEEEFIIGTLYNSTNESIVKVYENGASSRTSLSKGQKRGNSEIETSLKPTSNKTSTIETTRSMNNVAPIIYFRINYDLVKKPIQLEKTIMEALESAKVTLKSIIVTLNGNLLVYPESNEDKKLIIDNKLLFPDCKMCDLELNKKQYQLMVKGINAENFESRYNVNLNQKYKIANVIPIKKKDCHILNMCKIELESKDDFESILNSGSLQLGLFKYKVEKIARSPLRCHNCKEFGHSIKSCKKQTKCAKFGKDSHENACENNEICCINCGGNHSSYFKGCQAYKDLIKKEILKAQEDKVIYEESIGSNRNRIPNGFIRNYSDTVRGSSQLEYSIDEKLDNVMKEIENKINSFATGINSNMNDIKTKMNELKTDIGKSFSKQLVDNNIKLCYFFIDLIKTMNPNCEKPSEKVLHTISNRFNSHQLGNISSNALKEYINKLCK